MTKNLMKVVALIAVLAVPPAVFCAETVKLRHIVSIYSDDKEGGLKLPEGVGCSGDSFIVADTGNSRLLRYSFQDETVKGGSEIKSPEMSYPTVVQFNSKGEVFALDGKQRRILRLSADGAIQGFLSPEGVPPSEVPVPVSFKIDNKDNIYMLDIFSGRVLVLDSAGKYIRQIDFPENYGFFTDLAVNSQGTVFLLDSVNAMIFSAPKDSQSFAPLTKSLKEYTNFPVAMTIDARGIIYLSDQNSGDIVILGQDGSFQGRRLNFGWKEGLLRYPSQLCINEKGEIFIVDRNNSRIQIFGLVR